MKTKEEILKDQVGSYTFDELIDNEPGIITAMDEYAKQQAIAFDEWKLKNHWLWDNSRAVYFNFEGRNRHETRLTVNELYDRFVKECDK